MTKSKKRAAPAGKGFVLVLPVLEKAWTALQDEKTRKLLVDNSKVIVDKVQEWHNDRKHGGETDSDPGWLGEKFGQGKLEQRVENLSTTIGSLSAGRLDLTEALAPVVQAVDQIRIAVEVAGRLPLLKRKQAHLRIDKELDRLEKLLFEAALPSPIGDE